MDDVCEQLRCQHDTLQHVANELPALRMELAFLRADLQALEERIASDTPLYAERGDPFARGGVEVPALNHMQRQHRRAGVTTNSDSDSSESQPSRMGQDHDKDGDTGMAVSLEPNVWDCAMMITLFGWRKGSKLFGKFNVIITIGLLWVNIAIQFLFVVAIKSMIKGNPYNDDAMLNMRLQEGQLYANMDHKTMTTKQQQTCNLKAYNMLGETVDWLTDYLKLDQSGVLGGNFICCMAMLIWVISIYSEVRRAVQDLIHSVVALPSSDQSMYEQRGGMLFVSAAPFCQKMLAVLVMVPRILVAWALCWYGMKFLAATVELRELLTNAVALEFVKSIDEMLFEAIMPRKLMGYVRIVKIRVFSKFLPLEKDTSHGSKSQKVSLCGSYNIAVQTLFVLGRLAAVTAVVGWGVHAFLMPTLGYTKAAYYELCGENTNFIYMIHPITRTPVFASLDPFSDFSSQNGSGALRCFYAAQYEMLRMRAGFRPQYSAYVNETLFGLLNGSSEVCWREDWYRRPPVACPEKSFGYFNHLATETSTQFYRSRDHCRDQDVFFRILRTTCMNGTFFGPSRRELAFFKDVHQCSDLRYPCNSTANMTFDWFLSVQQICPETCRLCRYGGRMSPRLPR